MTETLTALSTVSLDLTEIGREATRDWLRRSVEATGRQWEDFNEFWERFFAPAPGAIPARTLVVGDLARIVRHYRNRGPHEWIASVRRMRPIFLALVRTKRDESFAALIDDLLRDSDLRMIVCRDADAHEEVRECLVEALTALEPDSILEVRYSTRDDVLWVQFSDGLSGFVRWSDLGIADLRPRLVAESGTVGEKGKTVEFTTNHRGLFEVDSASIRAVLDRRFAREISSETAGSDEVVGRRLRSAREAAHLTQTELGRRAQLDQAVISRLERGRHRPRIDTLRRIANALGLSVAELLMGRSN